MKWTLHKPRVSGYRVSPEPRVDILAWTIGQHGAQTPSGYEAVATITAYDEEPERSLQLAKASLIAAAPEMFEALDAILNSLSLDDDEGLMEHAEPIQAGRAALAKARGETTQKEE